MRKLLVMFIILLSTVSYASHIVGGEFELLHTTGTTYELRLIVYFDVINGYPEARDSEDTVRIFRKADNIPMLDVVLPLTQQLRVDYFQPLCSNGEIITDKLIYSAEIELPASLYNDPDGYYIAWERCCRNYTITNIFSDPPLNGGISAGQTFYLEFPPVVKDGKAFINSSPQLFPPLNDYACPNRPYWVDFAGIDVDGDSLVYSLITPLNTVSTTAFPPNGPHAAPYPVITWKPGFSLHNILNGNPDLAISSKGFLTVTPTEQGLYVFAVKCKEFRDGEKIGEVIRDFQMLVLDKCPVASPPEIKGKLLTDASFDYVDNMSITFPNSTPDEARCIQVEVSDPDASSPDDNFIENIWLKVIPIGFDTKVDLSGILPAASNATLINGSVKSFDLCFGPCPVLPNKPYTLGIIAFDDACALPLSDTLRVEVNIEPPANTPAYFITADDAPTIKEGDDYQLQIEGRDDEQDILVTDIITDGFNLADVGMSFTNTINENGIYSTVFNWATGCDVYDFTERTQFQIKVVLDDIDLCDVGNADTLTLDLKVLLPPNTDPVISTDLPQLTFLQRMNDPIMFTVSGLDTDDDALELHVVSEDFILADHEINFPQVKGITQVSSIFNWDPGCNNVNLDEKREFKFYFILNDLDKCKFSNFDSLEVNITILPPANTPPQFSFVNLNEAVSFQARQADVRVGDALKLEVVADDIEGNEVNLQLLPGSELPEGASFSPVTALKTAKSILNWNVECFNLTEDLSAKTYLLQFAAGDDACYNAQADTVELTLNVEDIQNEITEFMPANVFTPNKDGVNDFYFLPDLPLDDCTGRFMSFRVFNRWGTEVYVTIDRDFKWDAKGLEAGVYYYVVEFSNREFNGPLSILH